MKQRIWIDLGGELVLDSSLANAAIRTWQLPTKHMRQQAVDRTVRYVDAILSNISVSRWTHLASIIIGHHRPTLGVGARKVMLVIRV
jgi:hypothetical protein